MILASLFGTIFQNRPESAQLPKPTLLVVNDDGSSLTKQILADLRDDPRFSVEEVSTDNAREQLANREHTFGVYLPEGFGEHLELKPGMPANSNLPKMEMWHSPDRQLEACWVEGMLNAVILRRLALNSFSTLRNLVPSQGVLPGSSLPSMDRPYELLHTQPPGVPTVQCESYTHSFVGMTIQYLLFLGMDSGLLLLRERKRGIWRRMQSSPLSLVSILLGKTLSTMAIAVLLIAFTFGFGYVVFGVSINGSLLGFAFMVMAMALLAASIGLLVASIGGNENRARSISILMILALSMLGGLWLPSFLFPEWVQTLANYLPTSWAMKGFNGLAWHGLDLRATLPSVGMLLAFSVGFVLVAVWRFRWSEIQAEV